MIHYLHQCVKSECVKRAFGILSDKKINWPRLTNLIKVDFKPDPEYYFTVEREDGESVTVHAKSKNEIKDQQELRGLIMAQADELPPPIKAMEFYEMIKALVASQDTVQTGSRNHTYGNIKETFETLYT